MRWLVLAAVLMVATPAHADPVAIDYTRRVDKPRAMVGPGMGVALSAVATVLGASLLVAGSGPYERSGGLLAGGGALLGGGVVGLSVSGYWVHRNRAKRWDITYGAKP